MPWAKSAVGGLVLLAIPFFVAGPIAGSVCLFLALCIALIAWTPLGQWLGIYKDQEAAEPASDFRSRIADFFREGDELRGECTTVPDGPPDAKLLWAIAGGTPKEQCEREEKARGWDARVAEFLWSDSEGKTLAPGWKAAGEPPDKAPDHPAQSMMNPSRLAEWYQGKLDYLMTALDGPQAAHGTAAADLDQAPASLGMAQQGHSARIYGGAEIGAVIRQRAEQEKKRAVHEAAEGEIGLALEEATELYRLLWGEWPHITPTGIELEEAIPDWREKTTQFVGAVLGAGHRAAFRTVNPGSDITDRLEAEAKFLGDLARNITLDSIRVNEEAFLSARVARRENKAAKFIDHQTFRAPGAPPPADLAGQLKALMHEGIALVKELSVPVEPIRRDGEVEVEGADAPDEWQEKADVFRQKAWDLLATRYPALLTTYRDGCNATIKKEREDQQEVSDRLTAPDKRSTLEKALDMANFQRGGPAKEVEITLDGLATASQRLAELSS